MSTAEEKKRAEEEKKRAEEDCLAVKNPKQMIAETIPAARMRISAATPAATVVKAAEAREESTRSPKRADGLKLTQTHGKRFTAKEKEPTTHAASGDTPETATMFDQADQAIGLDVKGDITKVTMQGV
jgi:hypothetical protein